MSDGRPNEEKSPARERRKGLTPEQRRLLSTPRASAPPHEAEESEPQPPITPMAPVAAEPPVPTPEAGDRSVATPKPPAEPRPREGGGRIGETKASRRIEMQHALLIIGALVFLALIFYAGRKFDRARYLIMSRFGSDKMEEVPDKFPGLTAEQLIEGALAAEREGDWNGAMERFFEAKRKDLRYQGIFFRVGKTSYDRGDFEGADRAFEMALKFGENIAMANHLRAIIAVRRHDLPAAERFAEAAAKAEPLNASFYYYWGEILRLNQRPREAIRRYEQAIQRSQSASETTLCRFKIRLARIETADASALDAEIEQMRQAGELSTDWLLTDAALQLHRGKIQEAAQLISAARATGVAGLFDPLAGDVIFRRAAEAYPEIAALVAPVAAQPGP